MICGTDTLLRGTVPAEAGDLRGGAALDHWQRLMAKGETCIRGTEFISRGYEHICEDLRSFGLPDLAVIWQRK